MLPSRKLRAYLAAHGSRRLVSCTEGQLEGALRDAFHEGILTWKEPHFPWTWSSTAQYLADHATRAVEPEDGP